MPSDEPTPKKKDTANFSIEAIGGTNWRDSDSSTQEGFDSRLGYSDTAIRQILLEEGEPGLYDIREREYNENPLYAFAVDSVVSHLLGFTVSGEGSKAVNDFLTKGCPTSKLELRLALLSAVRDGTGFMFKFVNGNGKLAQIKTDSHHNYTLTWISRKPSDLETARDKELDKNAMTGEKRHIEVSRTPPASLDSSSQGTTQSINLSTPNYYLREYPCLKPEDYRNDDIALIRLRLDDRKPYGQSIGRSCITYFRSLNHAIKDSMSAIKRLTGMQLGAALDLTDLDDDAKATAITTFQAAVGGINWNAADAFIYDQRHRIGYIGMMEGTSSGPDGRVLEVMKFIEPAIAFVLLNFFIAIGVILQTGANKSIIAQQKLDGRKRVKELEEAWASILRSQIFYQITDKDVEIRFPPKDMEYEVIETAFSSGIISRQKAMELLGIDEDDGELVFDLQTSPMGVQSEGTPSTGSNDDNPSNRRIEPQRSANAEGGV